MVTETTSDTIFTGSRTDQQLLLKLSAVLTHKQGKRAIFHFVIHGKLRERARGTKSRAVIGYPSGQDGTILPARDCPFCSRNFAEVQADARKFSFAKYFP